LVGRSGRVIGIDVDEKALITARQRAEGQGLAHLSFVTVAVDAYRPDREFDAVVGRHILIHMPDPQATLRTCATRLREGGVAAFQEYDFSVLLPPYPIAPVRQRMFELFRDFFARARRADMGSQLYTLLLRAGFSTPECRVEAPVDGGPDSPFYEWCGETCV